MALSDGRFAATMEWGLEVRGRYIHVVEPSLIVMLWDFESNKVPLPGTGTRAYLEIARRGRGCRLELTQLVSPPNTRPTWSVRGVSFSGGFATMPALP